jgi:hypothetical protein
MITGAAELNHLKVFLEMLIFLFYLFMLHFNRRSFGLKRILHVSMVSQSPPGKAHGISIPSRLGRNITK